MVLNCTVQHFLTLQAFITLLAGANKKMAAAEMTYKQCLALAFSLPTPSANEIERDLHRTLSESFGDDASLSPLRNILYAYSIRNPNVGYCQSMNFLAAFLLIRFTEAQAFWVLSCGCCLGIS